MEKDSAGNEKLKIRPIITLISSAITVIIIGTATAVFRQNRTQPKPRFYAPLRMVLNHGSCGWLRLP